jgi:hypothetical protein
LLPDPSSTHFVPVAQHAAPHAWALAQQAPATHACPAAHVPPGFDLLHGAAEHTQGANPLPSLRHD